MWLSGQKFHKQMMKVFRDDLVYCTKNKPERGRTSTLNQSNPGRAHRLITDKIFNKF